MGGLNPEEACVEQEADGSWVLEYVRDQWFGRKRADSDPPSRS